MESLVTKLKGVVSDDSLRKIDEVKITFKVLKILAGFTGSTSYEVDLYTDKALGQISVRKIRDGLSVEKNGNNYRLNNIEDGDVIFLSPSKVLSQISLRTYSTAEGLKLINVDFEGVYQDNFKEISLNGATTDLSKIPSSNICAKFTTQFNAGTAYYMDLPEKEVDIEELFLKYPNLTTIEVGGGNLRFINPESFLKFNKQNVVISIFSLTRGFNLEELKVEYFVNAYNIDTNDVFISGDYFGTLSGKEFYRFRFSGTFTYSGQTFENTKADHIGGKTFYVDGDVDELLINLAQNLSKKTSGSGTISFASYRTSASDSAIQTLQSKGWTISIPGGTTTLSVNSISTMSLIESNEKVESGNYRIAYQGNQLIIEPTEFPIYPADGVTVKEFQALEEANEFISENNLSTEVE